MEYTITTHVGHAVRFDAHSLGCKHNRTLVQFQIVKKCTYLLRCTVSSMLVLSLLHFGKGHGPACSMKHTGQFWPSTLQQTSSCLSQRMTVAWFLVAWSLEYQGHVCPDFFFVTKPPSLPPPLSPPPHSPQWGWRLRERHKQNGREEKSKKRFCFHSSLTVNPLQAETH